MQYIFLGTGKQATNIILCLYKNRNLFGSDKKTTFIGIDKSKQQLNKFEKYISKHFPDKNVETYLISEKIQLKRKDALAFITSPPRNHRENLQYLKDHHINKIVLEKPIATNIDDFNKIINIIFKNKSDIYIQEQYLYSRLFKEMKKLINNPQIYIQKKCGLKIPVKVNSTISHFYKNRIKDMNNRHIESILFIELPHILSLLYNVFGDIRFISLNCEDLLINKKIYKNYKGADIQAIDNHNIKHQIKLSNTKRLIRNITVYLSNNIRVVFKFPGRLRNKNTQFQSSIQIFRKRNKLHEETFLDDHLSEAVKSYILWKKIQGTSQKCIKPNKSILDIIHKI